MKIMIVFNTLNSKIYDEYFLMEIFEGIVTISHQEKIFEQFKMADIRLIKIY